MAHAENYSKDNWVFQEFLFMLGYFVQSNLMRQIDYLKVENEILRGKLGKRVYVTPEEKRRLIKYGRTLGASIRNFVSIVSYSTFRKWIKGGISTGEKNVKRGAEAET